MGGRSDGDARGVVRAGLHRADGASAAARKDLREARAIAEHCDCALQLVECDVEAAAQQLALCTVGASETQRTRAARAIATARRQALARGYAVFLPRLELLTRPG